jgi:hypothetical protein
LTRFCAAAGLDIVEGSVEQPQRDPPDLGGDLKGYRVAALELVRLNDRDALKAKNRVAPGTKLFKASFAALEESRRVALAAKFADCALTISFAGTESDAVRHEALVFLWKLLEEPPAQHDGEVPGRTESPRRGDRHHGRYADIRRTRSTTLARMEALLPCYADPSLWDWARHRICLF